VAMVVGVLAALVQFLGLIRLVDPDRHRPVGSLATCRARVD
jgi:hypothetical protein